MSLDVVYLLTRSDTVGGSHVHVTELARGVQAMGYSVLVLVGGDGLFLNYLEENGIPFRRLRHLTRPISPFKDWIAYQELRRIVRITKPRLLASHSAKTSWMARVLSASTGIPSLVTVHGWSFSPAVPAASRLLYLLAERAITKLPAHVITVSSYDRDLAVRRKVAQGCRMSVIRNGISDLSKDLRSSPAAAPPNIISVARFDAPKDHDTLIRGLARISGIPWTLTLVGDGPLMAKAQAQVRAVGLSERVWFAGFRTDVALLLSRAQVFVLLSRSEGLPISVLEAMRAGLPVLASNVGGIPEVVNDGQNGYLVPAGDDERVSHLLSDLLQNNEKRAAMGAASRDLYCKYFTFDKMLVKTLALYREVITCTT